MPAKSEIIEDLLKSCSLPQLKEDLDSVPIQREHFSEYHAALLHQLPNLFDFIQQNEFWLWSNPEKENQKSFALAIVLFSEITSPNSPYELHAEHLLNNANSILTKQMSRITEEVDAHIFSNYRDKLRTECWKRNLGAIHGFMRYMQLRCSTDKTKVMTTQWLMFSLSVGVNLHECHEPLYKQISARLFQLMFSQSSRKDILDRNIHNVIYDTVFKSIHIMNTETEVSDIWNCLFRCLDYIEEMDSFTWNQTDDMMDALIRNITLTSDALVVIRLVGFVTRLGYQSSLNRTAIERELQALSNGTTRTTTSSIASCRLACAANTSALCLRWAKTVLHIFARESYRLMSNADVCNNFLTEIHRCYMVCMLPIPLSILQHSAFIFWHKFLPTLMEALAVHNKDSSIALTIKCLAATFLGQLQNSEDTSIIDEALRFQNAFEQLLRHDLFVR